MGITKLFKIIEEKCPEVIHKFSLNEWRSNTIAIDISIFLNKFVKSTIGNGWIEPFVELLCTFKKNGIRAVCVFDGPNPPIEKKEEQEARRKVLKNSIKRLEDAQRLKSIIFDKYLRTDDYLPEDLQESAKTLFKKRAGKNLKVIIWEEPSDVYDALKELIPMLEKQTSPITNLHREKAWEITKMMGFATYQSIGEAETLCASMAVHGYVDAVISEDTDVMVYGTPWFLAYRQYKVRDETVCGIYIPELLEALSYSLDEFRDLCILLRCDYNKNNRDSEGNKSLKGYVPGAKKPKKPVILGPKKVISLIDEYRDLDFMDGYITNIEILSHKRCREIFTPMTESQLSEIPFPVSSKPDFARIEELIKENHFHWITLDYIKQHWKSVDITIERDC